MKILRTSVLLLALLTALTGVVYPLLVTGIAQLLFPRQANGSLIAINGQARGSELIGQPFESVRYFWGRPSATASFAYNAAASGGSNLGPTNPALLDRIGKDVARLKTGNPGALGLVPADLPTTSASGLDPQISPAAAEWQVQRVAQARGLAADTVRALIASCTGGRQWGLLGEPRVNVLRLNLALDGLVPDR